MATKKKLTKKPIKKAQVEMAVLRDIRQQLALGELDRQVVRDKHDRHVRKLLDSWRNNEKLRRGVSNSAWLEGVYRGYQDMAIRAILIMKDME